MNWAYILIGIYLICAFIKYIITYYFGYRYSKHYDNVHRWGDKSFPEYVWDGGKPCNFFNTIVWFPFIGDLFLWCEFFSSFRRMFPEQAKKPSIFKAILMKCTRKKYLLERVSKEV